MKQSTKGHLSNNGGIRGHSASEDYKNTGRVRFMQGRYDDLHAKVMNPDGTVEDRKDH